MVKRNIIKDSMDGAIVEAKQEYTKQLCNVIKPVVYETIFDIYTHVVERTNDMDNILIEFQDALKDIPRWNADVITENVDNVLLNCTFFNDLLSVVFLSNVRILSAVRMNNSGKKKIKIVVPTNEKFIHEIFKNVAKNIYNNPYLYSIKKYDGNVTNNISEVFELINLTIEDTIRNLLPFQNIIESYVRQPEDEEEDIEELEDIQEDIQEDCVDEPVKHEPSTSMVNTNPIEDFEVEENVETNDKVMENFFGTDPEEVKDIQLGGTSIVSPPELSENVSKTSFFDDLDIPDPKKND
jgi:hypothetical protein